MKKIGVLVFAIVASVVLAVVVDQLLGIDLTESFGMVKAITHGVARGLGGMIIGLGILFFCEK